MTTYVVEGRGEFPTDMLRYDGSQYADDTQKVLAADYRDLRRIKLTGERNPCCARWASFSWTVRMIDDKPIPEWMWTPAMRLEHVARELCAARGQDPETMVPDPANRTMAYVTTPAWRAVAAELLWAKQLAEAIAKL